jgi:hypothetical protein
LGCDQADLLSIVVFDEVLAERPLEQEFGGIMAAKSVVNEQRFMALGDHRLSGA